MKIDKATHKAMIYKEMMNKNFPVAKLVDASNAAKKILAGSEESEGNLRFVDGEQEFTTDEWLILRDLVSEKKEAKIGDAATISELRELFELK